MTRLNRHEAAKKALLSNDIAQKIALLGEIDVELGDGPVTIVKTLAPGRPMRPLLCDAKDLERRSVGSPLGLAVLVHAIAHIEFNAINLALDAIYRFQNMPLDYYRDWLQVAREEAFHFTLLQDHLRSLGYQYGDFAAHNGLWEMTVATDHDVLARMALVPRILEARGLDATPAIQAKLRQVGDTALCEILDIILRDEIGHVQIGNRWYHWCCAQRNVEPIATFKQLLIDFPPSAFRGATNYPARQAAGFSDEEIELIASLKI